MTVEFSTRFVNMWINNCCILCLFHYNRNHYKGVEMDYIKNRPITAKSTALSDWLQEIVTGKTPRKIRVIDAGQDIDLPVFHLPYGRIYIGLNPPKPWELAL